MATSTPAHRSPAGRGRPPITILAPEVADLIAAGEVIERPAAVVKELVENALDAGARQIDISVRDGGKAEITVQDDGHGMLPEEVPLAVQRHATSKLRNAKDLERITTLGFRGEALASIAAVAKLTITSRPPESGEAFRAVFHGGRLEWSGPVGAPPGTAVTVEDLFFNTPARRKGLQSTTTEFARIAETVQPAALGHPHVAFKLTHNGRVQWQTPGNGDPLAAAAAVMGPHIARHLIPFEGGAPDLDARLWGYVSLPAVARAGRQYQFILVNGRPVQSDALRGAVEDAYRHLLPLHRWPVFIVQISLPYGMVDVNVHPTKRVVRFLQEDELADALHQAVTEALQGADLVPRPFWPGARGATGARGARQGAHEQVAAAWDGVESGTTLQEERSRPEAPAARSDAAGTPVGDRPPTGRPPVPALLRQLTVLGVLDQTYIVAKGPDGLYLIDQHAAHERVYFEHFMQQGQTRYPLAQQLAVPLPVELSPEEMAVWEEHRETVEAFGFRVESFGPGTLLLREVPWLFRREGAGHHLQELLAALAVGRQERDQVWVEADIALRTMAACKTAVKAHDPLAPEEIQALLEQLAAAENPYTCPHGRPTMIHLNMGQIERLFKRA